MSVLLKLNVATVSDGFGIFQNKLDRHNFSKIIKPGTHVDTLMVAIMMSSIEE